MALRLPAPCEPVPQSEPCPLPLSTCRAVLLVESCNKSHDRLAAALIDNGFCVIEADTAARALSMFSCMRKSIQIVLLDLEMQGMDALSLYRSLTVMNPDVRVVFLTRKLRRDGGVEAVMRGGMVGVMSRQVRCGRRRRTTQVHNPRRAEF